MKIRMEGTKKRKAIQYTSEKQRKTSHQLQQPKDTDTPTSSFDEHQCVLRDGLNSRIVVKQPVVRQQDDIASIKADLATHGYAVVGDILTQTEQDQFQTSFWTALQRREPSLSRTDVSTWTKDHCEWRGTYGAGQYKHYGMAQEAHCWQIRKHHGIQHIFESLFQTECCVSIDGAAAMFFPYQSTLPLHVDLLPDLPGSDFGSIQGSYNLYEVVVNPTEKKASAAFVCIPGSHHHIEQVWQERQQQQGGSKKATKANKHYCILDANSPFQQETTLIQTPANCLILWDSRLIHRNYGGDFTAHELKRPIRMTQFICWQPKQFRTPQVLQKKIDNVLNGNCGNHWAALGFREPVKPFPPWGNHKIPIINPFKDCKELPAEILDIL